MRFFFSLILAFYCFSSTGQTNNLIIPYNEKAASEIQLKQTLEMLKSLNEKGLDRNKDSVFVSKEFNTLLTDSLYRKEIYPEEYTWEKAIMLIQKTELKKAFWYLINLYPLNQQNKELVVTSVITYDALLKMDEVLINTFYTYAFTDPESSIIVNNKPEVIRPDILEEKLRTVNEIVLYIHKYREQKVK